MAKRSSSWCATLDREGNGSEINESLTNTTNSNALIVYTISTIDNNGCENQETISFELYPELNITNSNKSICSGENVDLTFVNNNNSPQLSYSWSRVLPNGITSSSNGGFNGNTISETLINSTTNSIDVIYNVTSQVSGCAQTNAVTITVHPFASFTAQTLYSLDSGQTTSLIYQMLLIFPPPFPGLLYLMQMLRQLMSLIVVQLI